jgi:hypothetical protein
MDTKAINGESTPTKWGLSVGPLFIILKVLLSKHKPRAEQGVFSEAVVWIAAGGSCVDIEPIFRNSRSIKRNPGHSRS